MSSLLRPRDYQEQCITSLLARFESGGVRVPSVLATGLGKTVIFAHLIARWVAEHPLERVMVLVHTDELVQQAVRKIREVAPHLRVGIVKAERNEVTAQVIVASVQSLRSAGRREQIKRVGLIIVDECHHATAITYRNILEHYEGARVAGFTATLARGDKAKLSEVWESDPPPFTRGISFGIRRGYLLDVRGRRIVIPDLDMSKVKKSGGDYQDAALGEAMEASYAPEIIAEKYAELAGDRKGLVFWPLVETAEHGAAAFEAAGIKSAVIHGKLGREERRLILKQLAAGEVQCVHNVAVLTEGFDDPTISCVVIARPTRSAPLYQQMVGRGLRPDLSLPAGERGDCLVLDVVGASRSHDLRSLVDLSEKEISEEIGMDEELSLLAMEEMQEEEEARGDGPGFPEEEYRGETVAEEFDPLGRTTSGAWLKTFGETYFLPAGKHAFVLLAPAEEPGMYDVAWMTKDPRVFAFRECGGMETYLSEHRQCRCGGGHTGAQADVTEHRNLSLEMATSWAEEVMEELGGGAGVLSTAKAKWRKDDASRAQRAWATRNGISWEGLNKGELADLRAMVEASNRIDPVIGFMLAAR
jgi:superfamily II DNA or RNA helicase